VPQRPSRWDTAHRRSRTRVQVLFDRLHTALQPRKRRRPRGPPADRDEQQAKSDSEALVLPRAARASSDAPRAPQTPEPAGLRSLPSTPRGGVTATWSVTAPDLRDLTELDPIQPPQEAARRRRAASKAAAPGPVNAAAPSTAEARARRSRRGAVLWRLC
jgi:hypothetical protein